MNSTALLVTWLKIQAIDTNGNITGYRICYSTGTFSGNECPRQQYVRGEDITTAILRGLNESTLYYVGVKAGTIAGFGPLANLLSNKTLEDSKCFS